MKLLNKLEKKFGKFAVSNLMLYIIGANIIVFVLSFSSSELLSVISFNPYLIKSGQVWRIFSFLMMPPTFSPIWFIFAIMFYYFIGQALESHWGSFKFNVYYFLGWAIMVVSGLIFNTRASSIYLNSSLFLAFAYLYPDYTIRIYFILPVKVKWLAYFQVASYVYFMVFGGMSTRIAVIAGLLNFVIFFGKDFIVNRKNNIKAKGRRREYQRGMQNSKNYVHKCHVCGRTELDDPNLEFRYCSKCNHEYEYCMDHLYNHEHINNKDS